MKNNINKVELCYGCSACVNICPKKCISMKPNKKGFLEPVIDESECINCGACVRICPRLKERLKEVNKKEAYIVKNKDEKVRKNSSSGGVFSLIADYIIENKGVIYGCVVDDNLEIKHIRTEKDYSKMRGSKYVKSNLGFTFSDIKKDLLANRLVLFTGTPCECAGLRNFLGKEYDNLYVTDFVCHGPQSPLIWNDFIKYITSKNGKIKNYYFRSKINGWHYHTEVIEYENGKIEHDTLDSQISKELFHLGLSLRDACYNCQFTNLNRVGDITMGDAWGIENNDPEYDDNKGVSLILINNEKGKKLFKNINKDMIYKKVDVDKYTVLNPRLKSSRPAKQENIDKFWRVYNKKGFNGIVRKYTGHSLKAKTKKFIKRILIKLHLWH